MQNSLLQFFREAVAALPEDQLDREHFRKSLNFLRETLEETLESYSTAAPRELENLRHAMRRSLTLYLHGLSSLERYLNKPDEALLTRALSAAQAASDLVDKLERHLG